MYCGLVLRCPHFVHFFELQRWLPLLGFFSVLKFQTLSQITKLAISGNSGIQKLPSLAGTFLAFVGWNHLSLFCCWLMTASFVLSLCSIMSLWLVLLCFPRSVTGSFGFSCHYCCWFPSSPCHHSQPLPYSESHGGTQDQGAGECQKKMVHLIVGIGIDPGLVSAFPELLGWEGCGLSLWMTA